MRFKPTEIATIAVAGLALVGSILSTFYTYTNRNRELDIELVKIGIGILRADPKETQSRGAREWAVQIIETHSRLKFSGDAKRELLDNKLGFTGTYDSGFFGTSFYSPSPGEKSDP